jgi:hypothetical protein
VQMRPECERCTRVLHIPCGNLYFHQESGGLFHFCQLSNQQPCKCCHLHMHVKLKCLLITGTMRLSSFNSLAKLRDREQPCVREHSSTATWELKCLFFEKKKLRGSSTSAPNRRAHRSALCNGRIQWRSAVPGRRCFPRTPRRLSASRADPVSVLPLAPSSTCSVYAKAPHSRTQPFSLARSLWPETPVGEEREREMAGRAIYYVGPRTKPTFQGGTRRVRRAPHACTAARHPHACHAGRPPERAPTTLVPSHPGERADRVLLANSPNPSAPAPGRQLLSTLS